MERRRVRSDPSYSAHGDLFAAAVPMVEVARVRVRGFPILVRGVVDRLKVRCV